MFFPILFPPGPEPYIDDMTPSSRLHTLDSLPGSLPVFPLGGVLLLPRGRLPLHIFEPRYRAMVEDALRSDRLIGMIQPRSRSCGESLYPTGCAGRIVEFVDNEDGRYFITLSGVCRFSVAAALEPRAGYRRVVPDWSPWQTDLAPLPQSARVDRARLSPLLRAYLEQNEMSCRWDHIDGTPDEDLITCLAMICPFSPEEKQALLEARTGTERAGVFLTLLEMAVRDAGACSRH